MSILSYKSPKPPRNCTDCFTMPDAADEDAPLLGPSSGESPVRPRRLFEERRGFSSPLTICLGLSLGVWLSVRAQAHALPIAGANRTNGAAPPSPAEQPWERPLASGGPAGTHQRVSLPPAKPRAALPPFDGTPKPRAALSELN